MESPTLHNQNKTNFNSLSKNMISSILDYFTLSEYQEFFGVNRKFAQTIKKHKAHLFKAFNKIKGILSKKKQFSLYDKYSEFITQYESCLTDIKENAKDLQTLNESEINMISTEVMNSIFSSRDELIYSNDAELIINRLFFTFLNSRIGCKKIIVYYPQFPDSELTRLLTCLNKNYFCRKIRCLDLSSTLMNKSDGSIISDFLKQNKSLKSLFLSNQKLGVEWLNKVLGGFSFNTTLEELSLCKLKMSVESLKLLREILTTKNETVKRLHLSQNTFNSIDYSNEIALIISKNKSIEFLDISLCQINNSTIDPIITSLKENKTLKKINIANNFISKYYAYELFADCLKQNKTLESLYVNFFYLDEDKNKEQEIVFEDRENLEKCGNCKVFMQGKFFERSHINQNHSILTMNDINKGTKFYVEEKSKKESKCLIF